MLTIIRPTEPRKTVYTTLLSYITIWPAVFKL